MSAYSHSQNPDSGADGFARRLRDEVRQWEAGGLISAEQAAAIRDRYPAGDTGPAGSAIGNRVVTVIAVMGAALIGLGIIAFIAANWHEMGKWVKLGLMVAGTAGIYGAGWLAGYRFGYPRVGIALILLGALAYGASIHLVAQLYHVPVNHPNLTPLWFVGVVPLAYITRSRALLGLSIILFLAAAGFRTQEWLSALDDAEVALLAPAFLLLGGFLFAAGRFQGRLAYTRGFARMCEVAGLLVAALAIYALSFNALWVELADIDLSFGALSVEYWLVAGGAGVAAAGLLGAAAWVKSARPAARIRWEAGALAAMGLTAGAMWLGLAYGGQWLWWAFNLTLAAVVLAMIAAGYRWNRAYPVNAAIVIFAVTLFTRYFEFGFDLLGQSVAFIAAGVILLAGGFALEYLRRRLVRGMRETEATQ